MKPASSKRVAYGKRVWVVRARNLTQFDRFEAKMLKDYGTRVVVELDDGTHRVVMRKHIFIEQASRSGFDKKSDGEE